jgi:hypothetical protein
MFARLVYVSSFALSLAACPSDDMQAPPDAPAAHPDAHTPPPPPPPPPLRGYGEVCTSPSQCQSNLCVGETGGTYICSRPCTLTVAQDCKDVDAFCVPIGGGDNACYGTIDTGNDTDDAVVQIGDTVTRVLSPLGDADLFLVHLDQLGTARFTVTPQPSIDVKIEAYGEIGSALGFANDMGPGLPESLETDVQQIGTHVFIVVRDVGSSTGGYTLSVQHVATAAPGARRF